MTEEKLVEHPTSSGEKQEIDIIPGYRTLDEFTKVSTIIF